MRHLYYVPTLPPHSKQIHLEPVVRNSLPIGSLIVLPNSLHTVLGRRWNAFFPLLSLYSEFNKHNVHMSLLFHPLLFLVEWIAQLVDDCFWSCFSLSGTSQSLTGWMWGIYYSLFTSPLDQKQKLRYLLSFQDSKVELIQGSHKALLSNLLIVKIFFPSSTFYLISQKPRLRNCYFLALATPPKLKLRHRPAFKTFHIWISK